MFQHLKRELREAGQTDLRLEERLRARNAILIAVALLCPIGVILALIVMLTWNYLGHVPDLMANCAYAYPPAAIAGIGLGMYIHRQGWYAWAGAAALLPLAIPVVFLGSAVSWIFG